MACHQPLRRTPAIAGLIAIAITAAGTGTGTAATFTPANEADLNTAVGTSNANMENDTVTVDAGGINLSADLMTIMEPNRLTINGGGIGGAFGIIVDSAGTVVLSGTNTFSGGTTLNAGALHIENDSALGSGTLTVGGAGGILQARSGDRVIGNDITINTALTVNGGFGLTVDGVISGDGNLTKNNSGRLILNGANTFTGGAELMGGQLQIGHNQALGTGTLSVTGGGTLEVATGTRTLANDVTVSDGTSLLIAPTGELVLDGVVSGAGGARKAGTGTVTLNNANTLDGGFTLLAGTIGIGNDNALGSSDFTVAGAGGTLQATGGDRTLANNIVLENDLDVDGANSLTLNGMLTGNMRLTKGGTGTLTINGNSPDYTGTTVADTGLLVVNGSLAGSNVFATADGTVGGTGTVGGLGVLADGIVAPGNSIGTMTVVGDIVFDAGSFFDVEVDPEGNSDRLDAGGEAVLRGTVRLSPENGMPSAETFDVVASPQTYTILTADGGLKGKFDELQEPFLLLNGTIENRGNDVEVTLFRTVRAGSDVADSLMPDASDNQRAVFVALIERLANAPEPDQEVLDLLNALFLNTTTEDELRGFLDQLSGEQVTAAQTAILRHGKMLDRTVRNRLDALLSARGRSGTGWTGNVRGSGMRSDMTGRGAAGDAAVAALAKGTNTWVTVYGGTGDMDGDTNGAGFGYQTAGFAAGIDRKFGKTAAGLAVSYGATDTDADDRSDETETESIRVTAFAGRDFGRWQTTTSLTYGRHTTDTSRQVAIGTINSTATGQFHTDELGGHIDARLPWEVAGVKVENQAGIAVTHLSSGGFTEDGAGGANLAVESEDMTSVAGTVGARVSKEFEVQDNWQVEPEARLAFVHEFGEVDRTIKASFAAGPAGGRFEAKGTRADRNTGLFGLGLTLDNGANIEVFADYETEVGASLTSHVVRGGGRMQW